MYVYIICDFGGHFEEQTEPWGPPYALFPEIASEAPEL